MSWTGWSSFRVAQHNQPKNKPRADYPSSKGLSYGAWLGQLAETMAAIIWQEIDGNAWRKYCMHERHATFHSHRPAIPGTALALFLSSGSHRHHVRAPTLSGCCCCCP